MTIPYACSDCGKLDPEGIEGHRAMRCNYWDRERPVAKKIVQGMVVANRPMVANGSSRHGKYADLEKRKVYQRELMRKRRAQKTA